jgi:exosortase A
MSTSIEMTVAWRRTGWLLALLLALVFGLFWQTWQTLPRIWWLTATYHHGFIILPISLGLVWLRRRELARTLPRRDALDLAVLAGFVLLWVFGQAASTQAVQHVAVVGMLIGVAVTVLGRDASRVIAFPLLFLFFMVPEGEFLVPPLQDVTAQISVVLLRLIDIPVFHSGHFIETPSGLFHVAEACAGIRFLIANVVVATLFAHLSFERVWKWIAFLALAVLVPILANALRAFGIIYIAYLTDNEYAVGVDHIVYGWGFFTVIMLLLLYIGSLFADRRPTAAALATMPDETTRSMAGGAGARPWLAAASIAVLLAGLAYVRLVVDPPTAVPAVASPAIGVSTAWQRLEQVPDWRPQIRNADLELLESYASGDRRVDLAIAYFAFQRQGAEVVNYANRVADGERWSRASQGWHEPSLGDLPRLRHERLLGRGERREVLWWYWVDGTFTADRLQAKWLQFGDRLFGRHRPAAIVAVSTLAVEPAGSALATLEAFLGQAGPLDVYLAGIAAGSGTEQAALPMVERR